MNDPWARMPTRAGNLRVGGPDLEGAVKAMIADIGAGLVDTLRPVVPIWAQDSRSHSSADGDLVPFRRKLAEQERSVTDELIAGDIEPSDAMIVQDALDIGAMDLGSHPENARWFATHPDNVSSPADRWWALMLAAAVKRSVDNARRFPLLRAEYVNRADGIYRRARDLVLFYEEDYRMWMVKPNPALAGVGAQIAYAVRTYPDRHRFDTWFYSVDPQDGVRRMLRDEHPELLAALDNVARMPGTATWWPLPRPPRSHDDDEPWYETATEAGISMIPFVGEAVMAYEAVLGQDLFGRELSAGERAIRVVGIALPALGRLAGESRAAITMDGAAVRGEDALTAETRLTRVDDHAPEPVRVPTEPGATIDPGIGTGEPAVLDPSAIDTGAFDPGAIDTGALDTGAADTGGIADLVSGGEEINLDAGSSAALRVRIVGLEFRIEELADERMLTRLHAVDPESAIAAHELDAIERDISIAEFGPRYSTELEPGLSERRTPGRGEPESTASGNFAHKYAEPLRTELSTRSVPARFRPLLRSGRIIPLGRLPGNLAKEVELGVTARVDRIGMRIFEIKPNTAHSIEIGLRQVDEYVRLANARGWGGRHDWTGVVVIYDAVKARRYVK